MTAPFEIMVATLKVYTGPVNEARPDLNDAVGGNWTLLGLTGKLDYTEDGVIVTPEETIEEFFALGSTAPQKAFRTQERFTIGVTVADMTAETLAKVFNDATVNDTAAGSGTAGVRDFDILQGVTVTEFGLLLRGDVGPYIASSKMQWWTPRVYVESVGPIAAVKGEPGMYEVVFAALEHASNGFGKYEVQDEAAS
ncbi:MAG: hypothetical protein V3S68_07910 [Dehalococcoidia bacterium]